MTHKNSIEIYQALQESGDITKRARAILQIFSEYEEPLRDWDVLQIFKEGSDNMNLVSPRLSELHDLGYLRESGNKKSHCSNTPVRTSVLNLSSEPQQVMF